MKIRMIMLLLIGIPIFFTSCKKDENSIKTIAETNSLKSKQATSTPSVATTVVTSIGANSATSGGNIIDNGGGYIVDRGVCWSITPNPTILNNKVSSTGGGTSFICNITGLSPLTTYYVRAYATSVPGGYTGYGNEISFTTTTIDFPVLTTTAPYLITATTAKSGGNVTYNGSSYVIAKGVCWSTAANPTIADNKTSQGSGGTSFTSSITGLSPFTTYHVRAYATNIGGYTAYGIDYSFTTYSVYPVLTTNNASAISATYATSGGNVVYGGDSYVISKGVCWSTNSNPTIANNKTSQGSGSIPFISSLTNLTPTTTYYCRAYATNISGNTGYGNEISFTTTAITNPILTTTPATSISSTSAISGGNISDDGGLPVTARGVCWNTTGNPTIGNSKTTDGSGTGTFTSSITGLTLGNYYFVRAYASNSINTTYGNEIRFRAVKIGDIFQGGKIAYIFQPGDPGYVSGATKGIIASTADQSSGIQWYNGSNKNITTSSLLYFGSTNTSEIINQQEAGTYAASCCRNYQGGGYTDWSLPSKNELHKLFINKTSIGGFEEAYYWSSTQYNISSAHFQNFYNGITNSSPKDQTYHVRAIRYF